MNRDTAHALTQMRADLRTKMIDAGLPNHMHAALERYVFDGILPGGFLEAVLSNNLMEAVTKADYTNLAALKDWVMFVYWNIPSGCWKSDKHITDWVESGGLEGRNK